MNKTELQHALEIPIEGLSKEDVLPEKTKMSRHKKQQNNENTMTQEKKTNHKGAKAQYFKMKEKESF